MCGIPLNFLFLEIVDPKYLKFPFIEITYVSIITSTNASCDSVTKIALYVFSLSPIQSKTF